ncbi:MAG: hypothetical protein AB7Q81_03050 [Gammaproteobacteria bacterium]
MAASVLKRFVDDGSDTLLWLEFEDYARQVFAGGGGDWYGDAARYAGTLIQAQGALKSDVLTVDVVGPFLGATSTEASAVVEALGAAAANDFVDQVLNALVHRFGGQLDIVLGVRAPADLLGGAGASFDDLDDVTTALTALVRRHADKPLAGLLLSRCGTPQLNADEVDAYEPLFGAARHYQWATALSFVDCEDGVFDAGGLDADLVLLPATSLAALGDTAAESRLGGGLNAAFWRGETPLDATAAAGRLLYGTIPADAQPETVLSVLRALRA